MKTSSPQKTRRDALRRYLVFRVKLIEFLDMAALWKLLRDGKLSAETPANRRVTDFADSIQTVLLSWFALFVDKNGMNVIDLWKELFPNRRQEIEQSCRMAPAWEIIREFRDRAGFHADKPNKFFNARSKKMQNQTEISEALAEFQKLQTSILNAESKELSDFPAEVDTFLDESEKEGHKYNRSEFKRYLMIPAGI